MASYFSLHAQRKVTKRKGTPISLPYGFPQHSSLPTGRPDSPSRLDRTKFDVPVEFSLPKLNASANFKGDQEHMNKMSYKMHIHSTPLCS